MLFKRDIIPEKGLPKVHFLFGAVGFIKTALYSITKAFLQAELLSKKKEALL